MNLTRDENDIIKMGEEAFFELSTLHAVTKSGLKLNMYFCSSCITMEFLNEEERDKIFDFLAKEKSDYSYRCGLARQASEKRSSYALEQQSEMLKEMKK